MRSGIAAVLAGLLALSSAPLRAEEVDVGLLLPFSGVYASLGEEIEEGVKLAVEMHGGETDATFAFEREDTEVKPPVGLAKARKLVLQDKVDVMLGVVSSGVLGALRDFVDGAGVPLIVANAGNVDATGKDCSPYIVRLSFSNAQVSRPMGPWLAEQGVKKVFTMAPDYAAGRQMVDAFSQSFTEAGGEIVGGDFTPFRQTQDFGPYLANAKASGADAVWAFYAGGEAIAFVKQYDSFGLKKDLPLYGNGSLVSPLYLEAEGPGAKGIHGVLNYVPTIDTPKNADFVKAYRERTGRAPSEYAVQGYDSMRALIEATKTGAADPKSLAKALPGVAFEGPRGPISIDPKTNNIVQPIYIFEIVEGEDGLTQKVLARLDDETDPPNGCEMRKLD